MNQQEESKARVAQYLLSNKASNVLEKTREAALADLDQRHAREGMPFMEESPEDRAVLTQLQRLLVGGDISTSYVTHLIETGQVNDRVALLLHDMYDRAADINADGSPELYEILEQIKVNTLNK
tara:strand:- start:126 stop:497 length:372 start_codon:yes stop_codon:yes gene_type:complete